MLPLEGIQVMDFTVAIYGAVCTMMLGDLGAEVIKVEPLHGDFGRGQADPTGAADSSTFFAGNRSKRSLAVNFRDPKGKEVLWRLAKKADVIVQNFRPGVMKEIGLHYEAVAQVNPRVIYASLSGYGETGPLARRIGGDMWAQAFTGPVAAQGTPNGTPFIGTTAWADIGGGCIAAFGITSALVLRERTGVGQEITGCLVDAAAHFQSPQITRYLNDGILTKKGGRGFLGSFPYGAYPARDGDVVTTYGGEDASWPVFCKLLGIEHLLEDPRYATAEQRQERKEELYPILDEAFRKKTRAEWQEIFRQNRMRCDPALDHAEFLAHPQARENRVVLEQPHPLRGTVRTVGIPLKFKGTPLPVPPRHPPLLGEHTYEVLLDLGYSGEEITEFAAANVVGLVDRPREIKRPNWGLR